MGLGTPLISIITATQNAAEVLPFTLASIRDHKNVSLEWLVVDNCSTDGTVEQLEKNEDLVRWISEPDRGIYDAWNKACKLARGEWLLFLGAGDELCVNSLRAMVPVLATAHPDHDIVYGRVAYISPQERKTLEIIGEPWEALQKRWEIGRPALPPHPGVFHHRDLFAAEQPFDARYRIAGDSHFLLSQLRLKRPRFVDVIVNRTPIGGMSMRIATVRELRHEIRQINCELGISPPLTHRIGDWIAHCTKVGMSALPPKMSSVAVDTLRMIVGRPRRWTIR